MICYLYIAYSYIDQCIGFFFSENFHQSNAGQLTESSRFPGSENVQVDSTKSLDTGINK